MILVMNTGEEDSAKRGRQPNEIIAHAPRIRFVQVQMVIEEANAMARSIAREQSA